ncbi:YqaJ domain-containing protein, partial [Aphis craccivora]
FENKKIEFLEKLKKTKDQILQIAKATIGQFQCQEWLKDRQIRLTASNFGKICKLRPNTSRNNILVSLLYTKFEGNESTKYGIQHEPFAISDFENIMKKKIHPAELFIDPEFQFLAASPDGLVDTDALVEIKCPSSISQMTPTEAIENGIIKWACLKNGELFLKQNHNYFYQVQG